MVHNSRIDKIIYLYNKGTIIIVYREINEIKVLCITYYLTVYKI